MKIFIVLFFLAVLLACGTAPTVSNIKAPQPVTVGTFYGPWGLTQAAFKVAIRDQDGNVLDTSMWTVTEQRHGEYRIEAPPGYTPSASKAYITVSAWGNVIFMRGYQDGKFKGGLTICYGNAQW